MIRSTILFLIFLVCKTGIQVNAQTTWPKEITAADGAVISIYEPQPEKYADNNVTARSAVAIRKKSGDEPVFGVMWFDAGLQPDNENKTASVKTISISKSKFSDGDEDSKVLLKTAVEKELPGLNIQFDLKRLNDMIQQEKTNTETGIKNDPPLILYRDKPTTLIVLDGEPVEQQDDDLKMTRVMNSPYLIVKNPDDNKYYLYGGNFWYSSKQIKTGWSNIKNLPSKIKTIDAALKEEEKKAAKDKDDEATTFTSTTDILISTEPAELLQTEGKPTYNPVEGSTLLYVDNTLDEIFKDIESQKNYILISGRWYSSANIQGPWEYVPSDALPAAFASIPQGSEKDGVLSSVAGTDAAEDAIMDANIPQTAKVERSSATCTVTYDGNPKFVPIENTNLSLAENSNITVMLAPNNQYYALENGIWFKSVNASGPWEVANERPSDVEKIPPSSSAYNAKYVQVYDVTPQYVYVGYTPGYLGSYLFYRTIVWGTGWRYRPWYGHWYYPRPFTWGFGMHYNPWTGWNISYGLSFNFGWSNYNRYHGHGFGWFGPPMFRPPYRPWGWSGGYYGNRPRPGRPSYRPNVVTNRPANWNNSRPQVRPIQNNIYQNRRAVVTRDNIQRPVIRPSNPGGRPTNPGVRPTNPVTRPGVTPRPNPGTTPTRPGTTRPAQPSPRPSTPRPVAPVTRPTPRPSPQPSTRPVTRPVARPATRPAVTRPATRPVPATDRKAAKPVDRRGGLKR